MISEDKRSDPLGEALRRYQAGDTEGAERRCRALLATDPDNAACHNLLGMIAARVGQKDLAIDSLLQAIALDKSQPLFYSNLGAVFQQMGRAKDAVRACQEALRCKPDYSTAYYNLGNALRDLGRQAEAEAAYRRALELQPADRSAATNLANLLRDLGRADEAIAIYRQLIAAKETADAWNNLAALYLDRDDFVAAEQATRQAGELDPRHAGACNNLGVALQYQGATAEAVAAFGAAIERRPDFREAHSNRFWALCLAGRLAEAWEEHDWRGRTFPGSVREVPWPSWSGESLEGQRLLVHGEQGIGDEIMFASCYTELAARAAGLVLECQPRLAELLRRSFPGCEVISGERDDTAWMQDCQVDLAAPAGQLPHYLYAELSDFRPAPSYLAADPQRARHWRERLSALADGRACVGVSWRGGGRVKDRRHRSIPLPAWSGVLENKDTFFVSLQYGPYRSEALDNGVHNFDEVDPLRDMDEFAALISALDRVVSVDNSTVHLAGALGTPTWVLLPSVPDWRWFGDGPCRWYASVEPVRQQQFGVWGPVLESVAKRLEEEARAGG
ncbi:MAG: tetratricopeptide repeat protein [Gammaproteobacteria bacterium]|nr:tetratricopeptide repeat protein [Gammaproteobacteria bacterium]